VVVRDWLLCVILLVDWLADAVVLGLVSVLISNTWLTDILVVADLPVCIVLDDD